MVISRSNLESRNEMKINSRLEFFYISHSHSRFAGNTNFAVSPPYINNNNVVVIYARVIMTSLIQNLIFDTWQNKVNRSYLSMTKYWK